MSNNVVQCSFVTSISERLITHAMLFICDILRLITLDTD